MFKTFTLVLFKERKGFTLIELMVVMVIITIITTIVLMNYRSGDQQLALNRAANKLAQDIRRAQEMTMSAAQCEPCGDTVPPGYGVVLSRGVWATRYRIYADDGDEEFDAGDTIIGEPIDLEAGVFIKWVAIDSSPANCQSGIVNFKPPDPIVNISSHGPNRTGEPWIEITLALELDDSKTKIVKVNQVGLIYVE